MPTVSPQQWNTQDAITSPKLNAPINQLAAVINGGLDDANIASLSGSKVNAGTVPVTAMTVDSNPETRMAETTFPFVASGATWSLSAGLVGTMTAGVVYINGKRIVVALIATNTFTASQDTYVSVNNTGTVIYLPVANNAASPTLPANSVLLGIVTTSGSAITNINQGQETMVIPIISGVALSVTDQLGNLICPRDPNRKILGYRQTLVTFTTVSTTATQVTGLSCPVIVPSGRKVTVKVYGSNVYNTSAASDNSVTIWNGVVASGTQLQKGMHTTSSNNYRGQPGADVTYTPSAGSNTFNAGFHVSGATGTIESSATAPGYIKVELA